MGTAGTRETSGVRAPQASTGQASPHLRLEGPPGEELWPLGGDGDPGSASNP